MGNNKIPNPGDPDYQAFKHIASWSNTLECFPTWEEIREIEYVRQTGDINMFTEDIYGYCNLHGLHHGADWIERCGKANIHPAKLYDKAVEHYSKDHGARHEWITNEFRETIEQKSIDIEMSLLESRMSKLKSLKKSQKKVGMNV